MEVKENSTTAIVTVVEEELADLPVADKQSDETNGGGDGPMGRLYLGTEVGIYR